MSLIIPPGLAQASIILRNTGDPDPWSITFGVVGGTERTDWEPVADNIAHTFQAGFLHSMNAATVLERVHLVIGGDGPDHAIYEKTYGFPGSGATEKLPQNCALLVRKRTGLAGRKGRGRMFIPNVLSDSVVNSVGVIEAATVSAFQDLADAFLIGLASATEPFAEDCPMVLLHTAAQPPEDLTLVTSLNVDSTISTQRRRLR
jgi:hypothetical protein